MANGLNKALLLGNLGNDPELRVTSGGQSVLNFNIACTETYLDRNRVRQEKTEWVRVVVWGKRAEALSKFLKKGAKVFVEGSIQTNSWEDNEGIKRYRTQVVARNVILGGGNRSRNTPDDPDRRRANRREHYSDRGGDAPTDDYDDGGGYDSGGSGDYDDDIPFLYCAQGPREQWWRW